MEFPDGSISADFGARIFLSGFLGLWVLFSDLSGFICSGILSSSSFSGSESLGSDSSKF